MQIYDREGSKEELGKHYICPIEIAQRRKKSSCKVTTCSARSDSTSETNKQYICKKQCPHGTFIWWMAIEIYVHGFISNKTMFTHIQHTQV